jgi:hypothetical protein
LTAFVCTACVALCPLFRPYQTRLPPRGDVRVSGRANTPSWVYRRRAHGPTLECHHSRQLHSLSVSQFGLFLGALLSTHNSIMYATRRASGAVVRLSLNSFYIKTHSGNMQSCCPMHSIPTVATLKRWCAAYLVLHWHTQCLSRTTLVRGPQAWHSECPASSLNKAARVCRCICKAGARARATPPFSRTGRRHRRCRPAVHQRMAAQWLSLPPR